MSKFISDLDRRITRALAFVFFSSLIFFLLFEWIAFSRSHLWLDELYALWAGDPAITFRRALYERILVDTNAPLYFTLIYISQNFINSPRAAILWLNGLGGLALLALFARTSWRKKNFGTALLIASVFLLTAPALSFAIEGRAYFFAMLTTLNAAFLVGSCFDDERITREDFATAVFLGVLASWLHVFSALFCGALGAALISSEWIFRGRKSQVYLGLTMSVSASIAFAVWAAIAFPMFSRTATSGFWLVLNRELIIGTLWGIKQYSIGLTWVAPIGILFLLISLAMPRTRALATVISITALLFFSVPFIVSLRVVILQDRYFLIGVPALLALVIFLLQAHLGDARNRISSRLSYGAWALGVVVLLAAVGTGPPTAWWHFATRWDWLGGDTVKPMINSCPEGEIRVLVLQTGGNNLFKVLTRGSGVNYVNAENEPTRDVATIRCPVYGWAEHYLVHGRRDWVERASVQDILSEFHLTNDHGLPLVVERHPGGLVLFRKTSGAP